MRIAVVIEWLDAWRGGAETSTIQFINHLIDRGVEVHAFTRSRPSSAPSFVVHHISGAAMSRTRQSMTFTRRVEQKIRASNFDLVVAISPCRLAQVYVPRGGTVAETIERNIALRKGAAARSFKRYAARFNFKQRYLLSLEKEVLCGNRPPIVVAVSSYVADQLRRHYAVPDERLRLIFNGVNPDGCSPAERAADRQAIRREFGLPDNALVALLIAHNFRLKGVRQWLEALAVISNAGIRDIYSFVIGKGDTPVWHRLAQRLNISKYVAFTGPSDRVAAFRHAADVQVHPTFYDPCSRVVLEAMASGLPCITTRWDGAADVIDHTVNGFVLQDPWDVKELAGTVLRLRDPELRARIGTAAKNVREYVSMSRHVDEMMALCEDVIPTGSRG